LPEIRNWKWGLHATTEPVRQWMKPAA